VKLPLESWDIAVVDISNTSTGAADSRAHKPVETMRSRVSGHALKDATATEPLQPNLELRLDPMLRPHLASCNFKWATLSNILRSSSVYLRSWAAWARQCIRQQTERPDAASLTAPKQNRLAHTLKKALAGNFDQFSTFIFIEAKQGGKRYLSFYFNGLFIEVIWCFLK
jgi:hypothetical protein